MVHGEASVDGLTIAILKYGNGCVLDRLSGDGIDDSARYLTVGIVLPKAGRTV
jgi:hypothetical protein